MRKLTYTLLVVCLVPIFSISQEINVSDLFIPTSPGLVLADKSPASIEKPSTPKTFGVSLLNLWQGGAVEATPYWFTNKPDLTYEKWINKKFLFIETFNLSTATFKTDTFSMLSIGARTQLLRIYSKPQIANLLAQEAKIISALTTKDANGEIDLEKVGAEAQKLNQMEGKGFVALELAGAILGSSANNSFKDLQSNKSGLWANLRWSPSNSILDFVGLVRYSWAVNEIKKTPRDSSFFDYGLSLNYEKKALNITAEYVNRTDRSLDKNFDRFTFVATYQINPNLAIVGSLGKNFNKVDNIITLFGLNVGISKNNVSTSD